MIWLRLLPWAGWGIAAAFFWLWIGGKEDLAREKEHCNAQTLASVAEAERITRENLQRSLADRIANLERQATQAERARDIAEAARIEAEARPERVRVVVREVSNANPESCLNQSLPDSVISVLRD